MAKAGRPKGSRNKNKNLQVFANGKLGIQVGMPEKKKVILPEDVHELALMGCTMTDMALYYGVEQSTFYANFRETVFRAREITKQKLRQVQLEVALEDKNTQMLIFLGKNMLGQTDAKQVEVNATAVAATHEELDEKLSNLNRLLLADELCDDDDEEVDYEEVDDTIVNDDDNDNTTEEDTI